MGKGDKIAALQKENAELKQRFTQYEIQQEKHTSHNCNSRPVMEISIAANVNTLNSVSGIILKMNEEYSRYYTLHYAISFNLA